MNGWFARAAVRRLHGLIAKGPVARGSVCIHGWPDHEENALQAAVLLARSAGLRVTLLADDPAAARRHLAMLSPDAPVDILPKDSLKGLIRASRAEALLFTHGLYGSPDLGRRKLVLNLWHGYGPKANDNAAFRARIPFDVMTCDTPVWGRAAARWLGQPDARLLPIGNPRQLSMRMPPPSGAFERLDLDPRRLVIWMPTYRAAEVKAQGAWRDAPALASPRVADSPVRRVAECAARHGLHLVVKPHPMDVDRYADAGVRVLTTEEILRSGLTLYQFIGASAAMISDYSSVWVEYLSLDRPLALFCPDLATYAQGRGFSRPTLTEVAPDLVVEAAEDLASFFDAVGAGNDWRPEARRAAREALQVELEPPDGARFVFAVLDEIDRRRRPRRAGDRRPSLAPPPEAAPRPAGAGPARRFG